MLYFAHDFLIFILPSIYAQTQGVILPYKDNKILEYCKSTSTFYRKNIFENPWYLFLLIILVCIFLLMFIGLIKGLLGICSKSIGELGLGLLVDLPKPIAKYREKSLAHLPVQYDIEGWPIHPYQNERSVRVFSMKTEFCLNVVFFLAYPLALCLHLCGMCCGRKIEPEDDKGCFCCVSMLKLNERLKKNKKGGYSAVRNVDVYDDNDRKEDEDTQYVINQMRQSQLSLQKGF
ncbi:unnamed protein product [Psylliodes chrysocephalus]|uniref:Uncharacterized protein n=1 Tax=Psylliodes chrysocephalus TaxID=3402493 RepID=A0A9P0CXZ5_9CUCU|nr:unnamed protein product [Psylliodes chrysocephala]